MYINIFNTWNTEQRLHNYQHFEMFVLFSSDYYMILTNNFHFYIYTLQEVIFMEINELINLIVNNGFPVAVSCYLLIRLEKQLSSLSASINKLNTIISTKLGVVIDPKDGKNDSGNVA